MQEYTDLKMAGSSSESEKDLVLVVKATYLGEKMKCPPEKPYYVHTFLLFGKCITKAELSEKASGEIEQWTEIEKSQGKERFIAGSSFCQKGQLYDSHDEVCVDPKGCDAYPNMMFNMQNGNCDCQEGYVKAEVGCSKEIASRECEYDSNCGDPSCSGTSKLMQRCDTRTYTCYTETVDCKEYFGQDATCKAGKCVE
jgi:hypothetical protein